MSKLTPRSSLVADLRFVPGRREMAECSDELVFAEPLSVVQRARSGGELVTLEMTLRAP